MSRKQNRNVRQGNVPAAARPAPANVSNAEQAPAADTSLPPWLSAWLAGHGPVIAVCGLLVLLVGIVFGQTLRHGFIDWDDPQYVLNNPHVHGGLSLEGIAWAFSQRYEANWYPLTWISYMLDWQVYGGWAGGHHLTSVLLHAATAVMLFLALRRLTGRLGCSALVAVLFAIHPLRVESVAWVAERKDVLSGFFFALTLWAYAGYARHVPHPNPLPGGERKQWAFSRGRYALVVAFFALGLMAKPMLVTLPFVLLLLDFWPLGGSRERGAGSGEQDGCPRRVSWHRLIVEKLPLFLLAAGSCVVTVWAQAEAIQDLKMLSLADRAANALVSYGEYIRTTFWPLNLAVYYPLPLHGWPLLPVVVSGVAILGISVAAIAARRRWPYLFSGWFWYVGMLVPVIGLVQVGGVARADRFTYLPQIGLLVALVWGADSAWRWCRLGPRLALAAAALVVLPLLVCAGGQVACWRDAETLWRQTIARTGENGPAHASLASILGRRGELLDAIQEFKIAFAIDPDQAGFLNNYGITLLEAGQVDEAVRGGQEAGERKPDDPSFHGNLALAYTAKQFWDKAIAEYRAAVELRPADTKWRFELAQFYSRRGRHEEAAHEYRALLSAEQELPSLRFYLANALTGSGAYAAAVEQYRKALERLPDSGEVWHNLGVALHRCGRSGEAIEPLRKAVELMPGNLDYRHDLAVVLLGQGKAAEAAEQLKQCVALGPGGAVFGREWADALRAAGKTDEADAVLRNLLKAQPEDIQSLNSLAISLLQKKKTAEAIAVWEKLLRIDPGNAGARHNLEGTRLLQWSEQLRAHPGNEQLMNNLAWALATSPDAALRNGKQALQLARQAMKQSGGKEPSLLDTLAAAYAEAGQYAEAVRTAREALQMATQQKNQRLAESLRGRLKLYEQGKPWRDAPAAGK